MEFSFRDVMSCTAPSKIQCFSLTPTSPPLSHWYPFFFEEFKSSHEHYDRFQSRQMSSKGLTVLASANLTASQSSFDQNYYNFLKGKNFICTECG
jgi:hypothetical protein